MALAAVACNKADVVEMTSDNAITFDNVFVDNATKSVSDPSYSNTKLFSDFAVYGFVRDTESSEAAVLFANETVNKSITNAELTHTAWKYDGTQYWIEGALYNFAAIAPKTNGNWTYKSNNISGTTISFTNDGEHDVLYAQPTTITGKASGNETVGFTFRHILSKVRFSFENGYNAPNTVLRVRNIHITNAYTSGEAVLTGTTTVWSDQETDLDLNFGNAATTEFNGEDTFAYNTTVESYKELLLIPADYDSVVDDDTKQLNITFSYDIVINGTTVKTFNMNPKVSINLEPGHAYDFKATITPGEPIEFNVTSVNGWDETNLDQTM